MADSFSYQNFRVGDDEQTVSFDYEIIQGDHRYQLSESLKFPLKLTSSDELNACLKALHLALGISYYKIFVSPEISHPYRMDEAEASFWNSVWRNGLGEFLYVNELDPARLAKFKAQAGTSFTVGASVQGADTKALLGIGGGKDSIVAGEVLKSLEVGVSGFVMATGEQLGQTKAVADTMGIDLNVVERSLDKQLLELQEMPGTYKGHIPISLIFGLVGVTLAVSSNANYVVVANEASASTPRVTWQHGSVNHQWSKSFEFEQALQHYIKEHISPGVTYFSAVRQLTSVAIAKIFANYPQYFEKFTSDNYVFRIDPAKRPNARWSLESPKSLSSFILLAPWLPEVDMLRIFGRNFLDEASLESLLLRLTGQEGEPPLDCVGTVEELVLSLNLAWQQAKFTGSRLAKLAQQRGVIADRDWRAALAPMLELQNEQALPPDLTTPISEKLRKELA